MSKFKGPGTPYPVPGTTLFVQKFDYSAAPWRITDGKGNQQHQFLHFDTRRDALAWGAKTTHLPWATPAGEWTDANKRALMDVVLQSPGYESYLRAIGASRAYASPVGLAPVQPERVAPVYQAPVRPEPTPLYDLPDPSAATFQNRQMGVDTPQEWRLPNRLFVSDLGLSVVPMDLREQFPEGVRFYQVVDAHMGYQDAESELLRAGFGHARSWHYSALDIPEFFRDAEGHSVHRWIRLFTGGGPKNPLRVWRDETPASSRPAPPSAPVPPGQMKMMKMWNPRKKVQQKPADWLDETLFDTHRGATLPVTVSCGSDWYPESVTEALEKRYSNQIERVSFGRKLPDGTTEADVLWVLFRPDTLDYLDRMDRS
jgi:hypothetical protein